MRVLNNFLSRNWPEGRNAVPRNNASGCLLLRNEPVLVKRRCVLVCACLIRWEYRQVPGSSNNALAMSAVQLQLVVFYLILRYYSKMF